MGNYHARCGAGEKPEVGTPEAYLSLFGKIPDFEKIISVNSLKKEINPVSLEYASLLHDVGKLGVPEAILNKPGKLTDEEWKIMYSHLETGIKILKPLKTFSRISD
jgi:hypothetical protein